MDNKKLIGWTVILHTENTGVRSYYSVLQAASLHSLVEGYIHEGKHFTVEPEWITVK